MTNEHASGDLLGMARTGTKRRLHALAMQAHRFDAHQLTLLSSLLDEFARKSHSRTTPATSAEAPTTPDAAA